MLVVEECLSSIANGLKDESNVVMDMGELVFENAGLVEYFETLEVGVQGEFELVGSVVGDGEVLVVVDLLLEGGLVGTAGEGVHEDGDGFVVELDLDEGLGEGEDHVEVVPLVEVL